MLSRSLAVGLTLLALAWVGVLLLAPILVSRTAPSPALAAVYGAAGRICHQRPERSFAMAGTPMPVCARCSGLYVAGAAGALVALFARGGRVQAGSGGVRLAFALAALPTAVTVILEWSGIVFPSNAARATAALPLGGAAGWIFVRLLVQGSKATRDMIA